MTTGSRPSVLAEPDTSPPLGPHPAEGPFERMPVGCVPILWNNADVAELRLGTPAGTILDEIARLGYEGCQHGIGFPQGDALKAELGRRGLRLAEVYAELPATTDGPTEEALEVGRDRLRLLDEAAGDVLCVALERSPDRARSAGRQVTAGAPGLSSDGWRRLGHLLDTLAAEARDLDRIVAFHPHAGTFVETPAEAERLLGETTAELVRLCLDTGHWLVGGGDPVAAIRTWRDRLGQVHLKDVDPAVLDGLRAGRVADFDEAIRQRLFTELGNGVLDLAGCLRALADARYGGWLMVEQDSSWGPPAEAAAIGRRVLAATMRQVEAGR